MKGAFETGVYRNVFLENGYTQEEIDRKIESSFQTMFYGPEEERIYHPVGEDMGIWRIPETTTPARRACPTE